MLGRYVEIYKPADNYDYTNNGITKNAIRAFVINIGKNDIIDVPKEIPILKLINIDHGYKVIAIPVNRDGSPMFKTIPMQGYNFIWHYDKFPLNPIPVFDRIEK